MKRFSEGCATYDSASREWECLLDFCAELPSFLIYSIVQSVVLGQITSVETESLLSLKEIVTGR